MKSNRHIFEEGDWETGTAKDFDDLMAGKVRGEKLVMDNR